ncbi:MAG: F0F1 ATP synthase subunit delta [Gammaproteobacteria bacterium]
MAEKRTIARPYAQAIFGLAQKQQDLAKWSGILELLAAIAADAQMQSLINNPKVGDEQLRGIFLDIGGERLDQAATALIDLLIENRRLDILPEIAALYESYRAEAEKVVQAEVISAFPVSDEQQSAIAEALKQRLGREVTIESKTDQSLIGGAIIRAGDMVIDGSVTGHLDRLSHTLSQ